MVSDGAPTSSGAAVVDAASSSSPPHPASNGGVIAAAATPPRKLRRLIPNGRPSEPMVCLPPDAPAPKTLAAPSRRVPRSRVRLLLQLSAHLAGGVLLRVHVDVERPW